MSQDERNTFTKRLKRYAHVGTAAGGMMAKLAGAKLTGSALDQEAFAKTMVEVLGALKGPLVKVAQLVAMVPDLLPPAYAEQLLTLQSEAPSMGPLFVKRRMRMALGADWQTKFSAFDMTARAAASIGQVHKAHDLAGRPLAVKLQYPDMAATVAADLAQLKLLFSLYDRYDNAIDHREILNEITDHLTQELDYQAEARNMEIFAKILEGYQERVSVPTPEMTLTTSSVLTMSWLEGERVFNFQDSDPQFRRTIAENLFAAWYVPLYQYGCLHGDPHTGNYRIRENGSISLFDFGCVRVFPPDFIGGIIDLYHALLHNRPNKAREAYEKWGFSNLTPDLLDALNLWATYLYGPILEDRIRPIDDTFSSQKGRQVAAEVQRLLKKAGGVRPPRSFVFVDRAAIGLGSVFMHLKVACNWHQQFESIIHNFSIDALSDRQKALGVQPVQ